MIDAPVTTHPRTKPAVRCTDLYKSFGAASIIQGLNIQVEKGDILALLGPSGCGKTTTLRLIAGFERPDDGRIEIAGRTVADAHAYTPPEQRRVGVVFQDYAIFPHLSVAQNIAFGLGRGQGKDARVQEMLDFAGLQGHGAKSPDELSGGQQQRVALARALAPQPEVLLLDEPFSNLDAGLRSDMRKEVRRLLKESGATAIFVTHDQAEAMAVGDRVAVMVDGLLQQVGTPEELFHTPATRFVAEFMGQTDFIPAVVTATGLDTPFGPLPQQMALPAGAEVELAVRPDDVSIEPDADGDGQVVEREFVGIANIYRVALPSGDTVCSWADHTVNLAPGTRVRVAVTDRHALTCFHQGLRADVRA